MPTLPQLLKSTFGYSTFRPLQREIIEANLVGEDVFALLPEDHESAARVHRHGRIVLAAAIRQVGEAVACILGAAIGIDGWLGVG